MSVEIRYRTCSLCEAMCGLAITVDHGQITKITGDTDDPFSRGYLCIKGEALADLHNDRNRLRYPVRRRGEEWDEISWDEAFEEVTQRILSIQKQFGANAIGTYAGNPSVHNFGTMLYLPKLLRTLRSRNRFSATSLDQLPHHFVAYQLYGHQMLIPIPDIDRTQYLMILGGNPLVSRGSMMTAPDITERFKAIRARGGKIILFDPRRTETAAHVDAHYFIRPATDAALLLGLLKVVLEENKFKQVRLGSIIDGLQPLVDMIKAVSLSEIETFTGIKAAQIEQIAREFASADGAVAYGRLGASTQEFGAVSQWLINVLNIITGNLDRPGGAMFTTPALDPLPRMGRGSFGRWRSRVRGLPEFSGELPASVMAEEMSVTGSDQIRGFLTVAGNPVLSSPNGKQLESALAKLDFMVSIDFFINETTRFAHIILPPTGPLEHEHYDLAFHTLAIRNTAKYSPPLFKSDAKTRHDWQILNELIYRLNTKSSPLNWIKYKLSQFATPERILDLGLRTGPYKLSLAKLKRHKHGLDLGPLMPQLPQRLYTKNKRINLSPDILVTDLQRLLKKIQDVKLNDHSAASSSFSRRPEDGKAAAKRAADSTDFDLQLIGRRQVRTNNSWMGHIPRLSRGKSTCTLLIHSDDAAKRGIQSSDLVKVTSRVGSITIAAVVVDSIMPGVVSIPHGFGHNRPGLKLDFDPRSLGVSINDITDADRIDPLIGTAAFNGVPVTVEKLS